MTSSYKNDQKFRSLFGVGPGISRVVRTLCGGTPGLTLGQVRERFPDAASLFAEAERQEVSLKNVKRRISTLYRRLLQENNAVREKGGASTTDVTQLTQPTGTANRLTAEAVEHQRDPAPSHSIQDSADLTVPIQERAVQEAVAEPIAPNRQLETAPDFTADQIVTVQEEKYQELNNGQRMLQAAALPTLPAAAFTTNDGRSVRESAPAPATYMSDHKRDASHLDATDADAYLEAGGNKRRRTDDPMLARNVGDGDGSARRGPASSLFDTTILRQYGISEQAFVTQIQNKLRGSGFTSYLIAAVRGLVSNTQGYITSATLQATLSALLAKSLFLPVLSAMSVEAVPLAVASAVAWPLAGVLGGTLNRLLKASNVDRVETPGEDDPVRGYVGALVRDVYNYFGIPQNEAAEGFAPTAPPGGLGPGARGGTSLNPFLDSTQADMDMVDTLAEYMPAESGVSGVLLGAGEAEEMGASYAPWDGYKPSNWPLGNTDNKLFVDNLISTGIRFSGPLAVLPEHNMGGIIAGGIPPFGADSSPEGAEAVLDDAALVWSMSLPHSDRAILEYSMEMDARQAQRRLRPETEDDGLFINNPKALGVRGEIELDREHFNPLITTPFQRETRHTGDFRLITPPAPAFSMERQPGVGFSGQMDADMTLMSSARNRVAAVPGLF